MKSLFWTFVGASAFNVDLSAWSVISCNTSYTLSAQLRPYPLIIRDVSEVTQMPQVFFQATAFNQTLGWEILDGTDTAGMFANSGGGSIDPSRAYRCNPKSESEWAALGCMVSSGQPRADNRGHLGKVTGLVVAGVQVGTCSVTCPVDGQDFVVRAQAVSCKPKTAQQWAELGCIFANPSGTTAFDLGTHNRIVSTTSCDVSCPIDRGDFAVTRVTGESKGQLKDGSWGWEI